MALQAKKHIYAISKYNPPLESREGKIKLDFNENTLGPSKKVIKALTSLAMKKINYYPQYEGFNEKIAKYAGVKPNQILATNGSDEAIKMVFDAFVSKNDEVIIPQPSFALFVFYAQAAGAKIKKPPYNPDFSFPVAKVLQEITQKTKLVIVCTPNNPTGTSLNLNGLGKILRKTKNGIVLVDEAYIEYSSKKSAVSLLKKYGNLAITKTFSKAFGLAGLRAGYLMADDEIISILKRAQSPYSVNTFAKIGVEAALNDKPHMKNYLKEVAQNKKQLEKFLANNKIDFVKSDSNFMLVELDSSKQLFMRQLKENNILVRDISKYPMLGGKLRFTIGDTAKNEMLIKALEKILDNPVLIFDMDGTLVDTTKSYDASIKKTFEAISGKRITVGEINYFRNKYAINNDWELTRELLKKSGKNVSIQNVAKKFQSYYAGKNFSGLILKEKLMLPQEKLKSLAEKYSLAIFTGRPANEAEFALKRFGIKGYFSEIVTGNDVPRNKGKPGPFGLNLIKKRFMSRKYIYFGDTTADVIAAKRAKTSSVAILPKNDSGPMKKLFVKAGAKKILKNIGELHKVVK